MNIQAVIGLEVHIQLSTSSKLFCADRADFGGAPNTHVSPISLAHPGTLPVLNQQALDFALQLGLALDGRITQKGWFDRKHYFYPDLPKGYQTTQLRAPVIAGGSLAGVAIHHVHLEEDAGKSIHDADPTLSYIDLNRAGVPLLELVTEPVMHDADTAARFLTELRKLVRWLGICDGNMEEGSLRCDANISIRPIGETRLGTKVEVKNINSIRFVRKAIEAEIKRQTALLEKDEKIIQQTRGYDSERDVTVAQRDKEEAHDYRYFPCPDLPPYFITEERLQTIRTSMPPLPQELENIFLDKGLPVQDAKILADEKPFADYFIALTNAGAAPKPAANWMIGPVKKWLNENNKTIDLFPVAPTGLAKLVQLVESGSVNFSVASTRILPEMIAKPHVHAEQLARSAGWLQQVDEEQLDLWVRQVLEAMPGKVDEYKKGKKGLMGLFVGEVKKISKGKADPQKTTALLLSLLS